LYYRYDGYTPEKWFYVVLIELLLYDDMVIVNGFIKLFPIQ